MMMKIQYGIAGFFVGAFIGLLIALCEMRMIDNANHPAMLFIVIALTVIACGITGLVKAVRIAERRIKDIK